MSAAATEPERSEQEGSTEMATTSSIQVVGKALAGQGGNGKGGNKGRAAAATAALGLSLAVGIILGQGQRAERAAQPSANPFAGDTHVATMWDYREDRRVGASTEFAPDPFTYREDRRVEHLAPQVPDTTERQQFLAWNLDLPGGTLSALSFEQQRFLEQNLYLPGGGTPETTPSDRSTYR